ncbi:MFS transporter [Nostocoides sp. F2B08]|uniref:MFS transporter n=1 Tax=Nostocoides sp. F2B08 TaxID=2653936 RepID=UPI001D050462|nr:MFS transporter [Tetrasphaera sp. F2B08]
MTTHPRDPIQRRTLGTLASTQVLGGIGLAAGIAVGSLIAEDITGSPTYAGLGGTFQVLGSALIAIPVARMMYARGRRPGLVLGYALALAGAVLIIAAALAGSFALLLVGSLLFGGATTSNSQSRFAAADLAAPEHRGRDLSIVVWATTIGSVLGPNLVGPAQPVARALGIPELAGPFVFSLVAIGVAIVVLVLRLRPDPLVLSRERERGAAESIAVAAAVPETSDPLAADPPAPTAHRAGSIRQGLADVVSHRPALLGLITLALGHATMVSLMVMTPLHMRHGDAELTLIGLVISIHILGMFALSPVVGIAADRFGPVGVAQVGSLILMVAAAMGAFASEGFSIPLTLALFLLGLGWSCTLVTGSTLLTAALTPEQRPGAQGSADLLMGLAAGGGGALAGVVVAQASYAMLAAGVGVLAAAILVATVVLGRPSPGGDKAGNTLRGQRSASSHRG